LLQLPLNQEIKALSPRLGDFAGWEMPLFFSSAADEHLDVRNPEGAGGIFDISHMGQVFCSGDHAAPFLNSQLTNDVAKLKTGRSHYSFLLNENGGVIDDLLLYRLSEDQFFIIFNASRVEEALSLLQPKAEAAGVQLTQRTQHIGLALQGPNISKLAPQLIDTEIPQKRNHLIPSHNEPVPESSQEKPSIIIATTGYTGEHGFEWFGPVEEGKLLWEKALSLGITPCGLVARDSLRLEAGLPLNGQDLDKEHSPTAAGLNFAVKLKKNSDFPGKTALLTEQENSPTHQLHGFTLDGPGPIPRPGQTIHLPDGTLIANVTSGGRPPTLGKTIGLAWFETSYLTSPSPANLLVRNKPFPLSLCPLPFKS